MDEFEELRRNDPEAYRRLLDSLPDVRDGLNRQQRSLLVTMRRLGVTSSSRTMSTAYVTLNTPSAEEKYHQPEYGPICARSALPTGMAKTLPNRNASIRRISA